MRRRDDRDPVSSCLEGEAREQAARLGDANVGQQHMVGLGGTESPHGVHALAQAQDGADLDDVHVGRDQV